jgi:Rrf2 family iron-sulfur cluster assembly transcriptional regulator
MIYSSACEYGIRGLAHLVTLGEGQRALVRDIAAAEDIPGPFLGKVFQSLAKQGVLNSNKGPGGGFSLARDPKKITLFEIRAAIDGIGDLEACAVGLSTCSDDNPCPLHETWKPIRKKIQEYLHKTTLAQMAAASLDKKKKIRRKK